MPTMRLSHDRHFEWEIIKKSDLKPGDVFTAATKADEVAVRHAVDWPDNFTLASWPESQIERELAARTLALVPEKNPGGPYDAEDEARRIKIAEGMQAPLSRNALVAEYLRVVGFKHHIPSTDDINFIEVIDDEDHDAAGLQAYLNAVFECKGEPAPLTGGPDPRVTAPDNAAGVGGPLEVVPDAADDEEEQQ